MDSNVHSRFIKQIPKLQTMSSNSIDQAGSFSEDVSTPVFFHYEKNTVEVPIAYMAHMIKENKKLKDDVQELKSRLQDSEKL